MGRPGKEVTVNIAVAAPGCGGRMVCLALVVYMGVPALSTLVLIVSRKEGPQMVMGSTDRPWRQGW